MCSGLPVWNAACSFEDATVIWQPISMWFLGGFLPCSHKAIPHLICSTPDNSYEMQRLEAQRADSHHTSKRLPALLSSVVPQLPSCCPGQMCSRFLVLLSNLNYINLQAKQNKTTLSGVGNAALCPGHMVQKQDQTRASILFRSSGNFNPLLEANH